MDPDDVLEGEKTQIDRRREEKRVRGEIGVTRGGEGVCGRGTKRSKRDSRQKEK